jgi:hypothetical protein
MSKNSSDYLYKSFEELVEDGWSRPLGSGKSFEDAHESVFGPSALEIQKKDLYTEEELEVVLIGLRELDKTVPGFERNLGYTLAKTIRSAIDQNDRLRTALDTLDPKICKDAKKGDVCLPPDLQRKVLQTIQRAIFHGEGPLWPHEQFVPLEEEPELLN